jgi:hypothetical protein
VEPFYSWNTPICWTGFILFADSVVWRARRDSFIRSAPGEFAALALASIPLWLVFEAENSIIRNWYYTGLPENPVLRLFGYAWSFATIWPAIFEGAELVAIIRGRNGQGPRTSSAPSDRRLSRLAGVSVALGATLLITPLLVPPAVARYLAAPVWLGFIFLLDPLNAHFGSESLFAGRPDGLDRSKNLMWSGLLCGVLWEFWNYWSGAKWHYTVPIMTRVRIFEMPLPGYFGFPAFALECFAMYVFARSIWLRLSSPRGAIRLGRRIAL